MMSPRYTQNLTSASSKLRPFGPPRDAQRYAHFVRVAALPVSHKTCIALVAPVAGVKPMEDMNNQQILECLKDEDGSTRDINFTPASFEDVKKFLSVLFSEY